MRKLNYNEALILNRIQQDLPVSEEIYHTIARDTSLPLKTVIDTIRNLISETVITGISGNFSSHKMGYSTAVAAFKASHSKTEKCCNRIVNTPGVTSLTMKENKFNIWLKICIPENESIDDFVKNLFGVCRADDYLLFRTKLMIKLNSPLKFSPWNERERKIPVIEMLDSCRTHDSVCMHDTIQNDRRTEQNRQPIVGEIYNEFSTGLTMRTVSENEIPVIQILQKELPVCENPFEKLIENSMQPVSYEDIKKTASSLKEAGILRKFSAEIVHTDGELGNHYLTAWDNRRYDLNTIINCFNNINSVTHLFLRETDSPEWNYTLFADIIARDDDELNKITHYISEETMMKNFIIMKTCKTLKNIKLKYFS